MVDGVCTPPHRTGRGFKDLYGSDFSSNTAEIVSPPFSVVLPVFPLIDSIERMVLFRVTFWKNIL